ncbi:hypothetical protein K8O92_09460 [Nocardia asteroides]|nr:hypothetical protein K8O92_09460 [Nocardia asteroides]
MSQIEYSKSGEIRIALFGDAGAGKSTTGRFIESTCETLGIGFARLRLAEPLYEAQHAIYEIAGRPLADKYTQDGELLSFLGSHLRKINPTALVDAFRVRLELLLAGIRIEGRERMVILCDDMRFPDWDDLHQLDFIPIRVIAHPDQCGRRRQLRGDYNISLTPSWHERNLDAIVPAFTVNNSGSIQDLEREVQRLVVGLLT